MSTQIQTKSEQAKMVFTLAQEQHWGVRVVGDGGMIEAPVYINEWWYIPVDLVDVLDSTPKFVQRRMDLILKSNLPIQGMIVSHEAPLLLTAPKVEKKRVEPKPVEIPWDEIKQVAGVAAKVMAVLAVSALVVPLALAGVMAGALTALDPALVIVLKDGTWVEVARWYESLDG